MGINRAGLGGNTGIKVESSLTIEKPRDEVYRFWRNFENFPRFMTHLQAVKVERGEGTKERSHWVAKAPLEQSVEWEAEIYDEVPDEMIAWRSLPGSEFENSGIVRFKDAPGGRGTVVDVSLRYNPVGGSASAAIARLLGEEPAMQVRDDLRRFKEVMETGETATVEGQTSIRIEQVEKEREEILRRKKTDIVQEASEESFPASDAPAWTVDPEV